MAFYIFQCIKIQNILYLRMLIFPLFKKKKKRSLRKKFTGIEQKTNLQLSKNKGEGEG